MEATLLRSVKRRLLGAGVALVTYFIEKRGWSVDQLLQTRLTEDEATEIMRAD